MFRRPSTNRTAPTLARQAGHASALVERLEDRIVFAGDLPGLIIGESDTAPQDVEVADLNGDGIDDFTIAYPGGSFEVRLGTPDGVLTEPTTYNGFARDLALGDFTGDGHIDVAVAPGNDASVRIRPGNGDGTFGDAESFSVGTANQISVFLADVNDDGDLDIISSGTDGYVWLNYGDGTGGVSGDDQLESEYDRQIALVTADFDQNGFTDIVLVPRDYGMTAPDYSMVQFFQTEGGWTDTHKNSAQLDSLGIRAGDLDGDGDMDIVVLADRGREVQVYEATGSNFTDPTGSSFMLPSTGNNSMAQGGIELADIDGDGNLDVVVSSSNTLSGVLVAYGNGDLSFEDPMRFSGHSGQYGFGLGHFDDDGILDAFAINEIESDAYGIGLFAGSPGGGFEARDVFGQDESGSPTAVDRIAVGDVNGDGHTDVVLAEGSNPLYQAAFVLYGDGAGGFMGDGSEISLSFSPQDVQLGDINEDGRLDLILAGGDVIQVMINFGGGFSNATSLNVTGASNVEVADFDNDGHLDIAATYDNRTFLGVWSGNGQGGFTSPHIKAIPTGAMSDLTTGDFDGDGLIDLAATATATHGVFVFLNNHANADRTFANATPFESGGDFISIESGDMNGNGVDEIIAARSNEFHVFYKSGDTWESQTTVETRVEDLQVGDVNADGYLDVFALGTNSYASLHLGNGAGAFGSYARYMQSQQAEQAGLGDVNGDGRLDVLIATRNGSVQQLHSYRNLGATSMQAEPGAGVSGVSNESGRTTVSAVNTTGAALAFEQDGVSWTVRDLVTQTGSPAAIGDPVTWIDPSNGWTYVAVASESGLIVYERDASGEWSYRDLVDELTGSDPIHESLVTFTSIDGRVALAGVSENGHLVLFMQTGGTVSGNPVWSYTNITTEHLEPQEFETPNFKELIAYVTPWDAWTLAGIDQNGRLQNVWLAPDVFDLWRADDLSEITGAAPIESGLSVILTSWSGINLTGLNSSGELVVTWWVPEFAGNWENNNLTDDFEGPSLSTGALTGYYTSWDGMNYAGINADGEVTIYWWVPSFGGMWEVSTITEDSPQSMSRPTDSLSSHAADSDGTLNLFGTDETGDVIRASWQPGDGGAWTLENLSESAELI